jgi:hypothetical protein
VILGQRVRSLARDLLRLVRSSDLAMIYAAIVVVVAVVLAIASDSTHDHVIAESSTNLVNLRDHPIWVLIVSLFVVSNLAGLWQIVLLLPLYAAAQRWVGRAGAIVVALIGHIGATLFVATLLSAGIFHGWLGRDVAREPDVGISYALAAVAGFLVTEVPRRWRAPYVIVIAGYFAAPLAYAPTFTAVGHATGLALGLALSLLSYRVARAALARSSADPLPDPDHQMETRS